MNYAFEDVNDDGYPDFVAHFRTRVLDLHLGMTEASLIGSLADEQEFHGTDSVQVRGYR
jgi:hypothetical protein